MSAIEEEMRKAAQAALAAGARRKQLAQSVASTASSSGSSGKRSHKSMVPTNSTQVTPEPKVSCTGAPGDVEPRALAFGNPSDEGEAEAKTDMTQKIYLNPEIWTDAQPRESQEDKFPATCETLDTAVDEPEETLSLAYEPESPLPDALTPSVGTLETVAPAAPVESIPTAMVADHVPLAPAPEEKPITPSPVGSVPTAVVASPMPVASPVREASQANLAQKKVGKPDESITFTPVTSAGMSAFFAAIRRPSTQMSFATESDAESTLAAGTTEPAVMAAHVPEQAAATPVASTDAVTAPTPKAASSAAAPPKATAPEPVASTDVVMAPTPEAASSAAAPPKATAPQPVASTDVAMAPVPEAASSATAAATPPSAPTPLVVVPSSCADLAKAAPPPPPPPGANSSGNTEEAEDPKQAKAQYMRYYRSVRSPYCPPAIRRKFDEANECPPAECQRKLQEFFNEFKRCNGDWLVSSICLEESRSHSTASCGIWRWVTVDDLKARYSEELVAKLCQEKEQNGETKPHPEFPGLDVMKLYYVWWEDSTSTTDRYEQRQNLVHDAGYGGGDDGDDDENGGFGLGSTSSHQKGKGGGKKGGKGKGKGGIPPTPTPKVPKEKKPKTPNQLARAAVATANNNILEIAQLNVKLTKAGVSDIIRNALIQQLEACEKELREGKSAVEGALASDQDLVSPTKGLDEANKKFKDELRHANLHLPKAVKPKAKAKAAVGTA